MNLVLILAVIARYVLSVFNEEEAAVRAKQTEHFLLIRDNLGSFMLQVNRECSFTEVFS
jgi:hypothetical protein